MRHACLEQYGYARDECSVANSLLTGWLVGSLTGWFGSLIGWFGSLTDRSAADATHSSDNVQNAQSVDIGAESLYLFSSFTPYPT